MNAELETQLSHQPTAIRFQEYTQDELNIKLIRFRGIISSSIPASPHASKFSNDLLAQTIEAMVYSKIHNSIVAQKQFIYYYENNKHWIEKCSYLEITRHLDGINAFISEIHKSVKD